MTTFYEHFYIQVHVRIDDKDARPHFPKTFQLPDEWMVMQGSVKFFHGKQNHALWSGRIYRVIESIK